MCKNFTRSGRFRNNSVKFDIIKIQVTLSSINDVYFGSFILFFFLSTVNILTMNVIKNLYTFKTIFFIKSVFYLSVKDLLT